MRVIACQVDCVWEDKAATHARVRDLLAASPPAAGALIVLPEMFATGFSLDVAKIAEADDGQTRVFLADIARQYRAHVLAGIVEQSPDDKGWNTAVALRPDGSAHCAYRKIHPFSFGQESEHYAPGDRVVTFDCQSLTVAPFVCYDLRFPEVFRHAAERGAQLLCVIANWPAQRVAHWVTLLTARAIENQAYVVGVNRCGRDPKLEYPGQSLIIDPKGTVLCEAGEGEGVIQADLDPQPLIEYRQKFPALRDMQRRFLGLEGNHT